MKKILTLTALAIAITATAALRSSWPTTAKYPVSIVESCKYPYASKLPSWPMEQAFAAEASDTTDVRIHPAER